MSNVNYFDILKNVANNDGLLDFLDNAYNGVLAHKNTIRSLDVDEKFFSGTVDGNFDAKVIFENVEQDPSTAKNKMIVLKSGLKMFKTGYATFKELMKLYSKETVNSGVIGKQLNVINVKECDYVVTQNTIAKSIDEYFVSVSENFGVSIVESLLKMSIEEIKNNKGGHVVFKVDQSELAVYFPRENDNKVESDTVTYPRIMNVFGYQYAKRCAAGSYVKALCPLALNIGFQSLLTQEFSAAIIAKKDTFTNKSYVNFAENVNMRYSVYFFSMPKTRPYPGMELTHVDFSVYVLYAMMADVFSKNAKSTHEIFSKENFTSDAYGRATSFGIWQTDADFLNFAKIGIMYCAKAINTKSAIDKNVIGLMKSMIDGMAKLRAGQNYDITHESSAEELAEVFKLMMITKANKNKKA